MKKACLILILLTFIVSACVATPAPPVTQVPEPSKTPLPTAISEATSTVTLEITTLPISPPPLEVGGVQNVPEGGFTFRSPDGYLASIRGAFVFASDLNKTTTIALVGGIPAPAGLTEETVIDDYLPPLFSEIGEYKKQNPHALSVDGTEGLAYDVSGTIQDRPLQGVAIAVLSTKGDAFFSVGFSFTDLNENEWENAGLEAFNAILGSITFSALDQSQFSTPCEVSTDDTYGYTQENAIKVGGDAFDGPPRERAFLDSLLGPDSKMILYHRIGSLNFDDTILDQYAVTVGGKVVTLFIDEYSWSEPMAPVGFQCAGPFPLSAP